MAEYPIASSAQVGYTYRESTPWWPEPVRPPEGSPDVIMVVLDDVGFGSLGCFGSEIATPSMDALADNGLTYSNFHVTPLCSPTRASLLTGRNHHSVGMSMLSNADSGYPGKRGKVSPRAAMLPELLRDQGYNTAAFGKWHLTPMDQTSSAGPYDQWPLGRGFEQYYGFLEGLTDQFFPELVQDNHRIDPPKTPEQGYHLTDDLVGKLISYISDHRSIAPEKPYFAYLGLGAAHCPHQAHQQYLDRLRGRYDEGWDVIRARRLQRQKELGLVPESTELAPRNEGVRPWMELSDDERTVAARLQEAFAAMLEHTDDQLGRLMSHLESLGTRNNTLIILLSDNGASQEGGPLGNTNTIAYENEDDIDLSESLRHLEDVGGWRCHSNYPWGWAQAGNTPLKRYKQNTHAGGIRTPLIMSWPEGIRYTGEYRRQFHDVIDITPTVMDIVGIDMPEEFDGIPQIPLDGTSMRYTFNDPAIASDRTSQYFEMYGHRAIIQNGWKAVAHHQRHTRYDDDEWELYHIDSDFSECHDLAQQHPARLHELIGTWWSEAERYGVFPLDDRNFAERAAQYHSPASPTKRRHFVFYPGMQRVPAGVAPLIYDRSYRIDADVQMASCDRGVLVAQGDVNGGYVLWVDNQELRYEYNHQGRRYFVSAPITIEPGRHILSMAFKKTGPLRGRAELQIDGITGGAGRIQSTARYMLGWQGLEIGRDALSPVSERYPREFPFTGHLNTVTFELDEDGVESGHEMID